MVHSSEIAIGVKRNPKESLSAAISRLSSPLPMNPDTSKIIVKPSILHPDLPGNSSLEVTQATTRLFQGAGEIYVVESDNPLRTTMDAFSQTGHDILSNEDVSLVNLSSEEMQELKMSGHFFESHSFPQILCESHLLVNIATLKVEPDKNKMSGGIKNLFGLLPEKEKNLYHQHLDDVLLDLLETFYPSLTIMDLTEITIGERQTGSRHPIGGIIVGTDVVAVDAFCAYLMGIDSLSIELLSRAYELGLGEARIERIGIRGTEHQIELMKTRMTLLALILSSEEDDYSTEST